MGLFSYFNKKKKEYQKLREIDKQTIANRKRETYSSYSKIKAEYLAKYDEEIYSSNHIEVSVYEFISILNELSTPYHSYASNVEKLKKCTEQIAIASENRMKLSFAVEKAKNRFESDYELEINQIELINSNLSHLLDDPIFFLMKINDFHKNLILRQESLYRNHWINQVKNLERKQAKLNRQKYVVEGYETMLTELKSISADENEINIIEMVKKEIESEDWSSL
ncbi:MAG: hypothetical protein ACPGSD_07835 [Flavobacteriales bacterium]